MKTYKVHLIRHALTQGNLNGQYIGITDIPICQQGIDELKELTEKYEYPKAEAFFRSPLTRCRQTLKIIYPEAKDIAVDNLRERDFGDFEGKTARELQDNPHFAKWLASSGVEAPPNGESIMEFAARINAAFEEIVNSLMKSGTTSAVIVAHGGTIMGILANYGIPRKNYLDWAVGNGRGYTLNITPSLWMRDKIVEVFNPLPIGANPELSEHQRRLYDSVRKAAEKAHGKKEE